MEKTISTMPLKASGSTRRYSRLVLEDGSTVIEVNGTSEEENRAFISLSSSFRSAGINVPEVLEVSPDGMSYIQEDLGDMSLWDAVERGRVSGEYDGQETALLSAAIRALPSVQFSASGIIDWQVCYPEPSFGAGTVDFDLNYFKYCFLKPSGLEFNEVHLQNDFECLKTLLLREDTDTFLYRDFQTRNIMLKGGEPWFIDFQGGRKGPIYYDVASFVWQARSRFPEALKRKLVKDYLDALQPYRNIDAVIFASNLRPFVLFRILQTLGAYGFRGLVQHRPHFLKSIPAAIGQLEDFLGCGDSFLGFEPVPDPLDSCPYLAGLLRGLCRKYAARPVEAAGTPSALTVDVSSFSYRKGLPEDVSGHGGGFVFDCRSIHNPGRYERYKSLTGRDPEVCRFLEDDGEVYAFLDSVYALVDAHVGKFLKRGFTYMQVAFGCTGGQHRSVYCAEMTAAHLKEKFGVDVRLTHSESASWPSEKEIV